MPAGAAASQVDSSTSCSRARRPAGSARTSSEALRSTRWRQVRSGARSGSTTPSRSCASRTSADAASSWSARWTGIGAGPRCEQLAGQPEPRRERVVSDHASPPLDTRSRHVPAASPRVICGLPERGHPDSPPGLGRHPDADIRHGHRCGPIGRSGARIAARSCMSRTRSLPGPGWFGVRRNRIGRRRVLRACRYRIVGRRSVRERRHVPHGVRLPWIDRPDAGEPATRVTDRPGTP